MANEQELIEALRRSNEATATVVASTQALATSIAVQAAAINALADSIAAATSEEVEPEPAPATDVPRYADGTPIGPG